MENLTQLVFIAMEENKFSGSISSSHWENLINLVKLDLSSNQLDGAIPSSLFSLQCSSDSSFPQMDLLSLASNKMTKFPDFLRNQLQLSYTFQQNQIQGKIPNWIWKLNALEVLNLSCNSLWLWKVL